MIKIDKKFMKLKFILPATAIVILPLIFFRGCSSKETTQKAISAPVIESIYALGTVKSDKSANIRLGMSSVISKFYVKEGDEVTAGSPLLATDSGVIIRSPISGVVSAKNYNENEIVPSGQVVLSVTDNKNLYVKVSLDQESIISVKKGMKSIISFENYREAKIEGLVNAVYESGGEFVVKIIPQNMPDVILPEMTCDVAIIVREKPSAILIPFNAVQNGKVKVKRNGKVEIIPVKVRKTADGLAEVIDGSISQGDIVFVPSKEALSKKNSNTEFR